jgi:hypothetical protein
MSSTTISRATWTDDDGTGTTGTILNNARLQADVYDKIDALFAGSNITLEKSNSGTTVTLSVSNTSNTASSDAILDARVAGSSAGSPYASFLVTSVRQWIAGVDNADSQKFKVSIGSTFASPTLICSVNGWTRVSNASANPVTGDFTATQSSAAIYTKTGKFVIAYNNGGTMTYLVATLNGSTTTWTNSTSAP